jgi:long-chain acyl-CoA synthetase
MMALTCLFGTKYGFYSGDVLKLMNDIALLKPTIFAAVPRIYNRIFDKISAGMKNAPGLKGYLA